MSDLSPYIYLLAIPSCIAIAIIDYLLLSEWTKCENCNHKMKKWFNWLLPSVLEILLFLAGIAIGKGV